MQAYLYLFRRTWDYLESQAYLYKSIWRHLGRNKAKYTISVAAGLAAMLLALMEPYVLGRMLNQVQQGHELFRSISIGFALIFGIRVGFWFLFWIERYLEQVLAFVISKNFKEALYSKVTSLPLSWHRGNHSGKIINEISTAAAGLRGFTDSNSQYIEMVVRFIGAITILTLFQRWIGVAAVIIGIGMFLSGVHFTREMAGIREKIVGAESRAAVALHDYISNITTVISLRIERLTKTELGKRLSALLPLERKHATVNESKWLVNDIGIAVLEIPLTLIYCWITLRAGRPLLAGSISIVFYYLADVESAFHIFSRTYGEVAERKAQVQSVDHILQAAAGLKAQNFIPLPENWDRIRIEKVAFEYSRTLKHGRLSGITITIPRGRKIALIGKSGSGKTTFLKLLRGLEQPNQGSIVVDGSKMPIPALYSLTTYIPQEPEIFENTIQYNITLGIPASANRIQKAMEAASFDTVVERLPRGLQTFINEKGVNLSGGERQRLALARGIFFADESDIILLDEPTSSIDTVTEGLIHRNIFNHFPDKTFIAVLHKLHLLTYFDYVYVFDNGKIVNEGTPHEVLTLIKSGKDFEHVAATT